MNIINYSIYKHLTLAVSFCLIPVSTLAQIEFPESAFSDHALLEGFADSEIISRELEQDVSYSIVLGSLQRTRGQVVAEDTERLRGDVSKIVYEVSQEFTGEDVYQFFREQMQAKSYSELFSCSGRACGSSNFWANDIFSNRILYGPERNQFYMAMRTNTGLDTESYIALYIITRGNRRIYANLEFIEPGGTMELIPDSAPEAPVQSEAESVDPVQAADLLSALRENRSVVLAGLNFRSDTQLADSTALSNVVELLNDDASLRVYLVAHLQGNQPLEELLQRSAVRAATVRASLISLGVDGERIIAQGVGPLAPACDGVNCSERVELVLQ